MKRGGLGRPFFIIEVFWKGHRPIKDSDVLDDGADQKHGKNHERRPAELSPGCDYSLITCDVPIISVFIH